MPSISLQRWANDRRPRLAEIDAHCAATAVLAPPNDLLAEESLRGYVLLLSGHFQGFCRDLYTECAQVFTSHVAVALQATIQVQFSAELKLNSHNPTIETIRKDFERFDFILNFTRDAANAPRITCLGHMNKWRNAIAHQKAGTPAGVPALALPVVRDWLTACDGLGIWLDAIMYNEMQRIQGAAPW